MNGINYDPTALENAVIDTLYTAGVSANVFPNRPRSSERDLADFVVCRISGGVRDRGALAECVFNISLFARDVANMKNGKKLSVLQNKLHEALPYEIGSIVFKPYSFTVIGDAPDGNGYHARVINVQAFVKQVSNTE